MPKTDLKKTLKHLYNPPRKFTLVEVPDMQFLMVDGHGDPNTAQEYQDAVEALYAVAYKVKFASKRTLDQDYVVPPLEGLWWAEDMSTFVDRAKSEWDWTMMIMQPDWIDGPMVDQALQQAAAAKDLPALPKLRLERYHECPLSFYRTASCPAGLALRERHGRLARRLAPSRLPRSRRTLLG